MRAKVPKVSGRVSLFTAKSSRSEYDWLRVMSVSFQKPLSETQAYTMFIAWGQKQCGEEFMLALEDNTVQ